MTIKVMKVYAPLFNDTEFNVNSNHCDLNIDPNFVSFPKG